MKKFHLLLLCLIITNLSFSQENIKILKEVLNNLERIKGFNYTQETSTSAPFDTLNFNIKLENIKMFFNPSDKFVGSTFYYSSFEDTTKYSYLYDGNASVQLDWEERSARIDSFSIDQQRNLLTPFFVETKSLIKYILENHDSVLIQEYDYTDSIQFHFTFRNKYIYFFNEPIIYNKENAISRYVLTINKTMILPVLFLRKFEHQIVQFKVSNIKEINTFNPYTISNFIPENFTLTKKMTHQDLVEKVNSLKGQTAPDWNLCEIEGDTIKLNDLKKKVVVIQFTTLGCGVCHSSVKFMKELTNNYKEKKVEIISIEYSKGTNQMFLDYKINNGINYKYIIATKELAKKYNVFAAPFFFVVDSEGIINDIFVGYRKDYTEKMVKETIDKLL